MGVSRCFVKNLGDSGRVVKETICFKTLHGALVGKTEYQLVSSPGEQKHNESATVLKFGCYLDTLGFVYHGAAVRVGP